MGFGAGTADRDGTVNATQVVIGDAAPSTLVGAPGHGQPVVVLETNVDDVTGETLADAVAALVAAGAHDAWVTPVVTKKGRPAHVVAALSDLSAAATVAEVLRATTGSLGVRSSLHERWPATRSFDEIDLDGHRVRIKVSSVRAKAEHDDAAAAARATGRSVIEVTARAEAAWWAEHGPDDGRR